MTDGAEDDTQNEGRRSPFLVVTGLSGAGRSTSINVLEDLGYEALDNFPISLIDALVAPVSGSDHPIAIGVETRTRGFSTRALSETIDRLRERWGAGARLIFLDCSDDVLIKRFSETRRRHPLAPAEDVTSGIARERDILGGLREKADAVIDTTHFTPRELRAELEQRFRPEMVSGLAVSLHSFAYKRGAPHGADMMLDCRFLRNPYWNESLRALDGRDPRIQAFVEDDPLFAPFFDKLVEMLLLLLPAYRDEGKAYFSVALGCTGGRHRSVTVAEKLAESLKAAGDWSILVRHRELERAGERRS